MYLRLELLEASRQRLQIFLNVGGIGHDQCPVARFHGELPAPVLNWKLATGNWQLPYQKPHERQPQLACVWNGAIVDQHLGRVEAAHELEKRAQAKRVPGKEPRTVAALVAVATLPVSADARAISIARA